ncbi:hypothetical protein SNEBB_000258 [Seison nebaliae]|nr:hypothetical protein SNEBB_000258 [Seison nebaliae]
MIKWQLFLLILPLTNLKKIHKHTDNSYALFNKQFAASYDKTNKTEYQILLEDQAIPYVTDELAVGIIAKKEVEMFHKGREYRRTNVIPVSGRLKQVDQRIVMIVILAIFGTLITMILAYLLFKVIHSVND